MMRSGNITKGFSLNELLVVMAVIGLLIGIGVPASKMLTESFASSEGTVMIIGAALANARAIAASEGLPAGIRFQQDAEGNQYMIFVIHKDVTSGVPGNWGFRAIEGRRPVRLPVNAGVMDLYVKGNISLPVSTDKPIRVETAPGVVNLSASDSNIDSEQELVDTTTFAILFSPTGRLVMHTLRVQSVNSGIFHDGSIEMPAGMFVEDNESEFGEAWLLPALEPSRRSFVIYDKKVLAAVDVASRYSGYLQNLQVMYVNPYTGDIIKSVP